jgi:hypothetical protein
MAKDKWIAGAIEHPGALHKALHVPEGKKIPQGRLDKAAHADDPRLAKMANLAKTLEHLHRRHGGSV